MINKKNYQHYILSKFNLPRGKSHKKPHKKWLDKYYVLFDKYCYPSIKYQTHKNFCWLIGFDETTIDKEWVQSHKLITPLYINNFSKSFRHYFKEYIKSHLSSTIEYLVTTRLDVDDTLHEDFMKNIHLNLRNSNSEDIVISFIKGLTHNTRSNKFKKWVMRYANPFITLSEKLEDSKDIKTVRCKKHVQIMKGGNFDLLYIDTNSPMWIQNIHGLNASNTMRGKPTQVDISKYHIKRK